MADRLTWSLTCARGQLAWPLGQAALAGCVQCFRPQNCLKLMEQSRQLQSPRLAMPPMEPLGRRPRRMVAVLVGSCGRFSLPVAEHFGGIPVGRSLK